MKSLHDMDTGGYINEDDELEPVMEDEGGQLKSKNGQKYIINNSPRGKYISSGCWYFTLFLVTALILISVVLLVLLINQPRLCTHDNGHSNENSSVIKTGVIFNSASSNGGPTVANGKPKKCSHDPRLNIYHSTMTRDRSDDDKGDSDGVFSEEEDDQDIISRSYGWSPLHYKLTIEPNFERSINNGTVVIHIAQDYSDEYELPPIVLDINHITIHLSQVLDVDNQDVAFDAGYGRNKQSYVIRIKERGC